MSRVRLAWLSAKTPWQMYLSINGLLIMSDFISQNKHFSHYDLVVDSHLMTYNLIREQTKLGVADLIFELYEELFVKYNKYGSFKQFDFTSIAHHFCESFIIRYVLYNHEAFGILFAISNQFAGLFFNSHKIINILKLTKKYKSFRKIQFVNAICILLTFLFYRIIVVFIFIEYALRLLIKNYSNGFYLNNNEKHFRFYWGFIGAWSCLAIPDCVWFRRCIKFWKKNYIKKKYHTSFTYLCYAVPILFYCLIIRYYLWNRHYHR